VVAERVHSSETRFLKECIGLSYPERLNCLKRHSLEERRLRGDLAGTLDIFY